MFGIQWPKGSFQNINLVTPSPSSPLGTLQCCLTAFGLTVKLLTMTSKALRGGALAHFSYLMPKPSSPDFFFQIKKNIFFEIIVNSHAGASFHFLNSCAPCCHRSQFTVLITCPFLCCQNASHPQATSFLFIILISRLPRGSFPAPLCSTPFQDLVSGYSPS